MKKLLPLVAVAALAAACNVNDNDYDNPQNPHARAPHANVVAVPAAVAPVPSAVVYPDGTTVYRPDGTYAVAPAVVERGYQHKKAEDALSDRSLGATRGSHGQPMTAKDSDHDGNYDYVPYYSPRPAGYYYSN